MSPLDNLLIKKGMIGQTLVFYRGAFNHAVSCYSETSGIVESQDVNDMVGKPTKLNEEIAVINSEKQKTFIFKGYQHGIFYKFQTNTGDYFIITQKELSSLTPKEKRELHMF